MFHPDSIKDNPTVPRVLLTGFGEGNQQLRVNGLLWGLDNWVYGANGRSDGTVRRPETPAANGVSISTRVSAFSVCGKGKTTWRPSRMILDSMSSCRLP